MAHFAELNNLNEVISVMVVPDDALLDKSGVEKEARGIMFCRELTGHSNWKQTSINTRDGVHYLPGTTEPSGKPPFRHNFAQLGMKYVPQVDAFLDPPPAPWFYVNEQMKWACHSDIGPKTGQPFTHNELLYIGHLINVSAIYSIVPLAALDDDPLSNVCTSTEYRLADITEITHGNNPHQQFYTDSDGYLRVDYHDDYRIDIDMTPLAVITAVFFKTAYVDSEKIAKFYFEQHPQNEAFSLHECFRLIIEWAYAFTDLNNNEPMAELAHNILRVVQMPIEIRDELLAEVPPQVVSLFLSEEDFYTPFNRTEKVPCPPLFASWIDDIRSRFPARVAGDPVRVNIEELPTEYPRT